MKIAALSWLLALVGLSDSCAQSLGNVTSITFTKQTRGVLNEVVISPDSVAGFVENHRVPESSRQYASSIDKEQWTRLLMTLKDVSLQDIDGLQSPTMNRAHDGAIHSTIEITFEDGRVISHSFDDENPHPDLQPLLDAILEFRMPSR